MVQVSIIQTIKKIKKNIFQISWLQWSEYLLWKLSNIIRFFSPSLRNINNYFVMVLYVWRVQVSDIAAGFYWNSKRISFVHIISILFSVFYFDSRHPISGWQVCACGLRRRDREHVCLSEWVSTIASKLQTIFFLLVLFSTEKWTEKIKPRFSNN